MEENKSILIENKESKIIGESNIIEEPKLKYISVVFEDTLNKGKFRGNSYNYKTYKDLKEGQVITVPTRFGSSKACVVKDDVNPDEITFDLDKIKEV